MKVKKIVSFLLLLTTVANFSLPVCANEVKTEVVDNECENIEDENCIVLETDGLSDDELGEKITEALVEYDQVLVFLPESEPEPSDVASVFVDNNIVFRSPENAVQYKVKNVKEKSKSYGSNFYYNEGDPDIVLGLQQAKTKTYSISVGGSYKVSERMVFDAAWNGQSSTQVVYSGTWKVPKYNDGKKVKKGILRMRPVYTNKTFDIYARQFNTSTWSYDSTEKTSAVLGTSFEKSFIYY